MASGIFAGLQIELEKELDGLVFESEHQLGTKPKAVDVLVVKKNPDVHIRKNIGHIFKQYNIIEYKGPTDYLSVDDFYKVFGYACFYKADVSKVDSIKIEEITITFVSHNYPRKFVQHLIKTCGYEVLEKEAGIYLINGGKIPMQLIWTQGLSEDENLYLRSLTNEIRDESIPQKLLKAYQEKKQNTLYQSVMDIVVRANQEKFEEVKYMCDALKELMKDELDERERQGIEQGIEQGIRAMIEACRELGAGRESTLLRIEQKFNLSEERAQELLLNYWEQSE